VESLLARGEAALPGLIVQFMFAHLENTYFSSRWWASLSADDQRHLTGLAMVMNPYYEPFAYENRGLVPWQLEHVELDRGVHPIVANGTPTNER
jgi:hypothetical protein